MRSRDFAVSAILIEGGYADLQGDAGGKTMFGLASNFHPKIRDKIITKTLTVEEAIDTYTSSYYKKYAIDTIRNDKVAFMVFDLRVQGNSTYNAALQEGLRLLGHNLKPDGIIGRQTMNAIRSLNETQADELLAFLMFFASAYALSFKNRDSYTKNLATSIRGAERRLLLTTFFAFRELFSNMGKINFANHKEINDFMSAVEIRMRKEQFSDEVSTLAARLLPNEFSIRVAGMSLHDLASAIPAYNHVREKYV